jgi:ribosomal protein S18 acetylase RimI-like enzyme
MPFAAHAYVGASDTTAWLELARAVRGVALHVVDLSYRLSSWALDEPDNVGLWVDERGRLAAWAVMQTPFWTVDYVYDPAGGAELHRRILAWADVRARQSLGGPSGRPAWFAMAFADQVERRQDLEAAGWACQAHVQADPWSKVLMARPAAAPLPALALPVGYVLRPLAGPGEIDAYVALHRAAFESTNMTVAWRARTLRQPQYDADLDLVAEAPDGSLAAFCVCWMDQAADGTVVGQVEPLGVHPAQRQFGLGRAVLLEGLRRLHARGAREVLVETDSYRDGALALYESVGFRTRRDVLVYRKDVQ